MPESQEKYLGAHHYLGKPSFWTATVHGHPSIQSTSNNFESVNEALTMRRFPITAGRERTMGHCQYFSFGVQRVCYSTSLSGCSVLPMEGVGGIQIHLLRSCHRPKGSRERKSKRVE